MMKTSLIAAVLTVISGVAHAGGQAGAIGVGAEYQMNGLGGASLNFDNGEFHVGGFLGFDDDAGPDNQLFGVGARFFYHVHSTAMSDFGVGGTLGVFSYPDMGPDPERLTAVFLEPGVQMRVFLAANVAISATTGVVIGVVDAEGVGITGQTITGGIHYYFF